MILNSPYISGSLTVTGNTTIQGQLTVTGSLSGTASLASNSLLLEGTGSTGFATTSSLLAVSSSQQQISASLLSLTASYNALSSSYTSLSASYNVASSSFSTRITSDSSSLSSRTTQIENVYATTGSNSFTGVQNFSNTCTPNSFTAGASLYTAGGLRVTQDAYFSSSVYIKGNVTVYGTQSVAYISSSQLDIGTNIITVNTATPSIRYGGLSVFDSGSTGLTGSILWDSELNRWIYSNASGSGGGATYGGGMFISGPRNSQGIGCEQGTTACMLLVGQGGDHLTSSMIYHSSTVTCIGSNASITSGGVACFAGTVCAPSIGVNYTPQGEGSLSIYKNTGAFINLYDDAFYSSIKTVVTNGTQNNLVFGTQGGVTALTLKYDQTACFASTVYIGGDLSVVTAGSTAVLFDGTNPTITLRRNNNGNASAAINFKGSSAVKWQIGTNQATGLGFEINEGDATANRFYIAPGGVASFAGTICAPSAVFSKAADQVIRVETTSATDNSRIDFITPSKCYTIQNLQTGAANALIFYDLSSSAERMRITSCGYVAVTGNQALSCVPYLQGMSFGWNRTNGQGESMINWTNAGGGSACDLTFNFRDSSTLYERLRIASTGAATFSSSVTVQGGNALKLNRSANDYYWSINSDASNYLNFGTYLANGTAYGTNPKMILLDSGNVGIGTGTPSSYGGYLNTTLQSTGASGVNLDFKTCAGTREGVLLLASGGEFALIAATAIPLTFRTIDTERMRITACGTVKTQCNQALGALETSGTIANNNCITLNLNSAGGNASIGFIAIGATRTDTTACQAVRLFSQSHTNGYNTYTSIQGTNDGGITITNNANGGETIYNCSGATVNYVVRYINLISINSIFERQ